MSRQSEKMMKEMHAFLEQHGAADMSEAELDGLFREFTEKYNDNLPAPVTENDAESSDDYLELAMDTEDEKEALRYAKKALKLDRDNLDAERTVAELSTTDPLDFLHRMEKVVAHGETLMRASGSLDEDVGHFWGVLETRPYMRARHAFMMAMMDCGMMRSAARECEEMLRLNEHDNLGCRYTLMHLYAYLEEEERALKLHERFSDGDESQMLLPLTVLFFKLGKIPKAQQYLKRLVRSNKDTKEFFRAIMDNDMEQHFDRMESYGYRPLTIEELMMATSENSFLYETASAFFLWAYAKTRK